VDGDSRATASSVNAPAAEAAWGERPRASVAARVLVCAILIGLPASGCAFTPTTEAALVGAAATGETATSIAADVLTPVDDRSAEADLDGDGVDERVALGEETGALIIADGPDTYEVRTKWSVMQATVADTDHDGLAEVVALVEDDEGLHIALFAWRRDRYRERLVTSELVPAPVKMEVYRDPAYDGDVIRLWEAEGGSTTYRWNGFGFTAVEGTGAGR
jgi:hypothetical protein